MKRVRDRKVSGLLSTVGVNIAVRQRIEFREGGSEMGEAENKQSRPVSGLLIAGASLALLFGIAILKARVK
jgi:hypothetical protein